MYIAATQINAGGLWEAIRAFFTDFEKMFPGFEGSLEEARAPFYLFGFVILVYSLVKKLSGPGMSTSSNMRAIVGIGALVGAMAFCMPITRLSQTAFLDLAAQMAPEADPVQIEESMEELLVTLTKGEAEKQQQEAAGGQEASTWLDKTKGYLAGIMAVGTNPGAAISAGLDAALASMFALLQYAMIYIVVALCKLAEMLMWLMILLQRFILLLNSIFLPVMIAMLSVGALSGVGTRYILSMFGVCAWPLGWGIVNAGTAAMIVSVNNTLAGATDLNSPMSMVWAYAICVVIPFWLVFGYIFGPFILQKMVTTGVGVAQGLLGGAASMAGTAATSAASLAMLGAGAPALAGASAGSSGAGGGSSGGGGSPSAGGGGSGSGFSGGGSGSGGASLAGTFAKAAGTSMQVAGNAVGNAGNALAATEGHSGVYSSNAGNSGSSANAPALSDGGPHLAGSTAGKGKAGGGSGAGAGAESASTAQIPQRMSNADLEAYAEQRAIQMATPPRPFRASDLYPGLTESTAEAWHEEQLRAGRI